MNNIYLLWDMISGIGSTTEIFAVSYVLARFLRPYFLNEKNARITGLFNLGGWLFAYFCPWEMLGSIANLIATSSLFIGAVLTEKRNIRQKIFLSVVIYLLPWIVHSSVVIPWNFLYESIMYSQFMYDHPLLHFAAFTVLETFYFALRLGLIYLLTRVINRIYIYKKENLSTAELILMMLPVLPALVGFFLLVYLDELFLRVNQSYIWEAYPQYEWLTLLYQAVSFGAVIGSVYMSQKIKKSQRDEKENAVLAEQLDKIKLHIEKLESVYENVRDFRHDVGNHLATLENLYKNNETKEAESYRLKISESLDKFTFWVKTGNPVTDIILDEKYRLARKRNIELESAFFFPDGAGIDVFDVSVILNNALDNAVENADGEAATIRVSSKCEKNAYLIEVKNSFSGNIVFNGGELPETTKNSTAHGFGLANIRRIAQKYHGDISLETKNGCAVLTVMMISEAY